MFLSRAASSTSPPSKWVAEDPTWIEVGSGERKGGVVLSRNMNPQRVTKEGVIHFEVLYADSKAAHILKWENYTIDPSAKSATDKAPVWCFFAHM